MREVIMSLIRTVIQKKYGPVIYSVMGSNHFPLNSYPNRGYGYIVTFADIPKELRKEIGSETKMLLEMLGLRNVKIVITNDILEVFGLEQEDI
jgi:hypothetical protein